MEQYVVSLFYSIFFGDGRAGIACGKSGLKFGHFSLHMKKARLNDLHKRLFIRGHDAIKKNS